jgi:hypothetical protein
MLMGGALLLGSSPMRSRHRAAIRQHLAATALPAPASAGTFARLISTVSNLRTIFGRASEVVAPDTDRDHAPAQSASDPMQVLV